MDREKVLVFACGNPSRGDDALGPELLRRLGLDGGGGAEDGALKLLTDFQLQIEHALDLQGRQLVLFIDASMAEDPPYGFRHLEPAQDSSYTTHAMNPAAVLWVYRQVLGESPPPAFMLAVRGYRFELGEPLSPEASRNLDQALDLVRDLLATRSPRYWKSRTTQASAAPRREDALAPAALG